MKRGLIVFAREPLPGQVKTRLAAAIGNREAAEEYDQMLQEVLKSCRQLTDISSTVYWSCHPTALARLAERYQCFSQQQTEGNLGQRMQRAFGEMFAEGYEVCCIIGSDAPDLPRQYIEQAFRLLETGEADVVFGPSTDGGYYLLGMCRIWPQLFSAIPWSSSEVLRISRSAAEMSSLSVALLPEWQDIDTLDDLLAYRKRLLAA